MSDTPENTVDLAHEARDGLIAVASMLGRMAAPVRYVGLGALADKIMSARDKLSLWTEQLYDAWNKEFRAHCSTVQGRAPLMLEAALAGIELGRRGAGAGDGEEETGAS